MSEPEKPESTISTLMTTAGSFVDNHPRILLVVCLVIVILVIYFMRGGKKRTKKTTENYEDDDTGDPSDLKKEVNKLTDDILEIQKKSVDE